MNNLSAWTVWAAGIGFALSLSGCGLPTWGELIGAKKEEQAPVVVVPVQPVAPMAPAAPEPPPPPPKPEPETVIADFQALQPHQIDDARLLALTELDEGLEVFEELDLTGASISKVGLKNLGRLTHLSRLNLRGTRLDVEGYAQIAAVSSLEHLQVDGAQVPSQAIEALRPLANLKILSAPGLQLSAPAWDDLLLNHPEIEELSIPNSNANDLAMTAVGKLANLKRLDVAGTSVTDVGLKQIAELEQLEVLDLSRCPVQGTGLRPPGNRKAFEALRDLNLSQTQLSQAGGEALRTMKDLRRLSVDGMPMMQDVHFKRIIGPLNKLEFLSIGSASALTGQALMAIAGNDYLQEIRLNDCHGIDDSGLRFLSKCKSLKRVDLARTGCTVQGAVALKGLLPEVEIVGLVQ